MENRMISPLGLNVYADDDDDIDSIAENTFCHAVGSLAWYTGSGGSGDGKSDLTWIKTPNV